MEEPKVKAQWDREANIIFCEFATKQIQLGHRPTRSLTAAGYQGKAEFKARTQRTYIRKQFRNRWDDMKAIYSAWIFAKTKQLDLDKMM